MNEELQDISKRLKEAEAQVELAGLHTLPLWAFCSDAIIIANSAGRIIWWNVSAQVMFEYEHSDIQGKNIHILIPENLRARHQRAFEKVIATGRSYLAENKIFLQTSGLTKSGKIIPIELSLTTWISNNERFFGTIIRPGKT